MKSTMLQNPSDPEDALRSKAGKEHRGYVSNLEKSTRENSSVIAEYQQAQNNHSDSQFIQRQLMQMDNLEERTAYSGTENAQLAMGKKQN